MSEQTNFENVEHLMNYAHAAERLQSVPQGLIAGISRSAEKKRRNLFS